MDSNLRLIRQKGVRLFVLLIALAFLLTPDTSCGQNSLTIKGKTVNGTVNYLTLSKINFWYFLPYAKDSFVVKNNAFIKTISVQNEPFFLYCGTKNLGLIFPDLKRENDTIELIIDIANSQILAQGEVKIKYEYFYSYQTRYRVNGGFDSSFISHLKLGSEKFISATHDHYQMRESEIKDQADSLQLQTSLVQYLLKTNYYEYSSKLYDYLINHHWFSSKKTDYTHPNSNYLEKLNGQTIDTNDLRIPEFGYLVRYIINNANDSAASLSMNSKWYGYAFKFNYANTRFSGKVRDLARALVIKDLIDNSSRPHHFQVADSLIGTMEINVCDKTYLDFCRKYSQQKNPYEKGLDFTLPQLSGNEFRLKNYSNRIVVLFFWGTWCGPCKKQIQALNEIISELQENENFVFANVALEKNNLEEWKKSLTKLQLNGINLYAEGLMENDQIAPFNITSVPRTVILISGQIYNFNAPMPLDGLRETLLTMPKTL